jgi:uncharacterized protein (TIGR02145 family)
MKKIFTFILLISSLTLLLILNYNSVSSTKSETNSDSIVVDYDGNVYHTITIGSQVWLKENLKSLHYSDGTAISGALSYNNSDSLANIYGRLYTWNATMRNSTIPGVQGVCPVGFHVPTDSEWTVLGNYLGGNSVAGGKLKEADTVHWYSPNSGADNSSGFTALAAGEWESGNFQFIKMFAVIWSSTQSNSSNAYYRYLRYDDAIFYSNTFYKSLRYSVRAIKNNPSIGINESGNGQINSFELKQNYPNPFNSSTRINYYLKSSSDVIIKISDVTGKEVFRQMNRNQKTGNHFIIFNALDLSSGIYFYWLEVTGNNSKKEQLAKSMLLIK